MDNQYGQQNQPPYQQPQYQQPSYYQPNYAQGQRPPKPDNYLVWAILCTLFCCLPLGIVSIVYSSKGDNLYYAGDYVGAQNAADEAKKWAMWGAIISLVIFGLYLLLLVFVGASENFGY